MDLQADPMERILNADEPAPYFGVLVPANRYKEKEADLNAFRYIKDHPPICEDDTDIKDSITIGLFSFSLGALVGALVFKH